jgi:cephalosporin hydroxylase
VRYLDFLERVHERLEPPTYLEIGIRHGGSLALTRSRSVGIDPAYKLKHDLPADVALFRETSDAYFARSQPREALDGRRIGMSFIDGLHLAEFALRDFVNVERHAHWTSAVFFDDIFPSDADMAARERHTVQWTGDVYKVLAILADHRPDLICLRVGTEPTGLLLVLGLDPDSDVLSGGFDALAAAIDVPDPQDVPADVLTRRGALDPEAVLRSRIWDVLREARDQDHSRRRTLRALRRAIRSDLRDVSLPAPAAADASRAA